MGEKQISKEHLEEFDYLKEVTYLDWACLGLPPRRTRDFCRDFLDTYSEAFGRLAHGPYGKMREETRRELARLVGCSPEEIIFTKNTTEGNCMLAAGLKFSPGDKVIVADLDYPGNIYCWRQKQKDGLVLDVVRSRNGIVDEDEIIRRMDGKTKVVALSYVQYGSGYKANLKKIGNECRKRGILFSVDGIQGIGRQKMNVEEFGIDLLSCAGFKGMLSVFGSAFVYCRREILAMLEPMEYGDNCMTEIPAYTDVMEEFEPVPLYEDYRRMEAGSLNTYGIGALGKSAQLINEIGVDAIHEKVAELETYFRKLVREKKLPVSILGSAEEEHWSGDISMCFDKRYTAELTTVMKREKIYATVEDGFIRIALHYCNSERDMERMADALESVLCERRKGKE
ncbi:MAG: aminotransferase class V-fold PLP-dependent enzyme [Anaerovoracaceae bacterium]